MKKCLLLIMIFFASVVHAQNPASIPSDSTLSAPEKNFETLWQTFEDHYAFFKLRKINWKETYLRYRPQINSQTSDDTLYTVFTKMLAPFQDNHINLIVPSVKQYKSKKPSHFEQEFSDEKLVSSFWSMVDHTLSKNGFADLKYIGPEFHGKQLFAYSTSKKYGYLRFNRCFVSQEADNIPDAAVARKILDTIFSNFKNVKNIIIDVRDNIGGNDEFAFEVAGRFTENKSVGMYKETRTGGYEEFGQRETWYIEPKGNNKQKYSVTLLTNDKTVSAGDVFAMIMKGLPNVRIIGENTRGIYSDMYGFELPNKWLVSLSNQRYYNKDMVCYEGNGTPVNIIVKNTKSDLLDNSDPVIIAALKTKNH
jgi:carboxyl-terminal processing protease